MVIAMEENRKKDTSEGSMPIFLPYVLCGFSPHIEGDGVRIMWTILGAMLASAVTTIVITARFRKEIMDYVEEVCDINAKAIKDYADVSERYVEKLAKNITHNIHE